jgi:D-sedoheptulose 7-phosphate isomerase
MPPARVLAEMRELGIAATEAGPDGYLGSDPDAAAAVARGADVAIVIPAPAERLTPHAEAFQAVVWHLLVSHPALKSAPNKWESEVPSRRAS